LREKGRKLNEEGRPLEKKGRGDEGLGALGEPGARERPCAFRPGGNLRNAPRRESRKRQVSTRKREGSQRENGEETDATRKKKKLKKNEGVKFTEQPACSRKTTTVLII